MKLLEAIIGIMLLTLVLISGASILLISQGKYSDFLNNFQEESKKVSLYNYSKYLVNNMSGSKQGFITLSGNNFINGATGDYYYECNVFSGKKINTTLNYSGVFCELDYKKDKIFNYKMFNN